MGIIPFGASAKEAIESTLRSAQSFLKHDPRGKVIIAHDSAEIQQLLPNVVVLPFTALI